MTIRNNKGGFTLIELLIAMAISTVVMTAIYSAYRSQLKSHITQQKVVEMQQNARAAMFVMEREIKMSGYDPDRSQDTEITVADNNTITFTVSAISDGIDNDGDGDIDTADSDGGEVQTITYSLGGQDLQRNGAVVAENIQVLDFIYLDENRNLLGPTPLDTDNRDLIRSIQITLIARSGENVAVMMMKHTDNKTYNNQQGDALLVNPNDSFRRVILTADVKCRNLGLN
ncbi:MAG: prepilin-type N-terminal cleavage/methylation domain-containing protein [Proteobacteria bacterium]|nr:prepilin-type N-terminal cleavage/methylation domain-containing protein [Pseudomonadota bacterium]